MSKSTITYRFDHKPPSKQNESTGNKDNVIIPLHVEEYSVNSEGKELMQRGSKVELPFDGQTLNQFTQDFGAWSSPFDVETEKLEKMIRESDENAAKNQFKETRFNEQRPSGRKTNERSSDGQSHDFRDNRLAQTRLEFDLESGYYEKVRKGNMPDIDMHVPASRYIRRTNTPWLRIITSISGAVITGVLFGFFVLSLFTDSGNPLEIDKNGITDPTAIITDETGENPGTGDIEGGPSTPNSSDMVGTLGVDISAQSYFVLQNGIFSSVEGAETAMQKLTSDGFAAAGEQAEDYYIFSGISTNRDDALSLSHQLQQKEFEVYIKPYTLPAISNVRWEGEEAAVIEAYFNHSNELAKMLSRLTVMQLQQTAPSVISKSTMDTLKGAHQTWSGLASQLNEGLTAESQSAFQKLNTALNTSLISLEAHNKNPSFAHLWQTQTAVMESIFAQKELLSGISGLKK